MLEGGFLKLLLPDPIGKSRHLKGWGTLKLLETPDKSWYAGAEPSKTLQKIILNFPKIYSEWANNP